MTAPQITTTNDHLILPGLATAHSHAFQRALRGRTQRRSTSANSFWSWRALMYKLVDILDPDDIYAIARLAYAELAMSGVTAIGEFHYLHHDKNGQPYSNPTETAEACIRAATDVGIRICLIYTGYMRGGFNKVPEPAQRRFINANVDHILDNVDALRHHHTANPLVTISLAAHSIRAVAIEPIRELAAYAAEERLPFHMHLCEQRQEVEESINEYGIPPVQLLADNDILSESFVGIHCTHLSTSEVVALGESRATICLCRTTERDLGDGLPPTSELVAAGAQICVGVDSHVEGNAFEEIRAIELDERSRLVSRHVVAEAPQLLDMATRIGYAACGMKDDWQMDTVTLNRNDPALAGLSGDFACDGLIFSATPRAVDRVTVAGQVIVENGLHRAIDDIVAQYEATLDKINL